jgi:hypothetical protein
VKGQGAKGCEGTGCEGKGREGAGCEGVELARTLEPVPARSSILVAITRSRSMFRRRGGRLRGRPVFAARNRAVCVGRD